MLLALRFRIFIHDEVMDCCSNMVEFCYLCGVCGQFMGFECYSISVDVIRKPCYSGIGLLGAAACIGLPCCQCLCCSDFFHHNAQLLLELL